METAVSVRFAEPCKRQCSPEHLPEFRTPALTLPLDGSRELRIRQAYVEHLENLTLEKDDEKEALQRTVMQRVTGVYKEAESEAIKRLASRASKLEVLARRLPSTSYLSSGFEDQLAEVVSIPTCVKGIKLTTVRRQAQTVRQPAVQTICEAETAAAVRCYQENSKNPLPCWDMVAAFEECARRARQGKR